MKFAVVNNYTNVGQVRDYLPANYKVIHIDENGQGVIIAGEDDAGWTLDEYVIPRFASGLIQCVQVYPGFVCDPARGKPGCEWVMEIPEHWIENQTEGGHES